MSTQQMFEGLAGAIDCAIDAPKGDIKGWALCLHPHPLFDGTRDNKVNTTFARACVQAGLVVFRPNFRGVGQSEGVFDESRGETQDMLSLIEQIQCQFPELVDLPCMKQQGKSLPVGVMWAGLGMWRFTTSELDMPPIEQTLLVHGQKDEVIALDEAFTFLSHTKHPVQVIPDTGHFFHGQLTTLKKLAQDKLSIWFR